MTSSLVTLLAVGVMVWMCSRRRLRQLVLSPVLTCSHRPSTAQSSSPAVCCGAAMIYQNRQSNVSEHVTCGCKFGIVEQCQMSDLLLYIVVQFSVYSHQWVVVSFSDTEIFIWSLLYITKVPNYGKNKVYYGTRFS